MCRVVFNSRSQLDCTVWWPVDSRDKLCVNLGIASKRGIKATVVDRA